MSESEESSRGKTFRPEQGQEQIAPRGLSLWHVPKTERPGCLAQSSDTGMQHTQRLQQPHMLGF